MAFNIQGAVQALNARSSSKSKHMCAMYVRMAMESGGLSTATRPNWAWKYISWLPSQGWSHIGTVNTNEAQAEFTRSQARPGDVAVYQKPGVGGSQPGHICMYSGSQWISDFRQNRMGVYSSPVNAYIFRYTGEISNAPIDISGLGGFGDGGSGLDFSGGFSELNTETLAAKCPEHIEFKGMWMRYQLQAGEKSPTMQEFMNNAGGAFSDAGWSGQLTELSGSDAVEKAMQLMAFEECGQRLDQPLPQKMLVGYQLKGEGHKTYGFGQMYNWNGTQLMERIKPVWTEAELREEFRKMATREVAQAKSIGLPFTDNQLAVLAHRYHFGPAPFNDLKKRMLAMGRVPTANEYREMALAYCRGCKNWNLYGKGWTNGVNREASHWA